MKKRNTLEKEALGVLMNYFKLKKKNLNSLSIKTRMDMRLELSDIVKRFRVKRMY